MNVLKTAVILASLTGIAGAVDIIADDEDWGNHVLISTWNVRGNVYRKWRRLLPRKPYNQ